MSLLNELWSGLFSCASAALWLSSSMFGCCVLLVLAVRCTHSFVDGPPVHSAYYYTMQMGSGSDLARALLNELPSCNRPRFQLAEGFYGMPGHPFK